MVTVKVTVSGSTAIATATDKITSGMVGIPVQIEYDSSWDGLIKNAVFKAGDFVRDRKNVESFTTVPWEVLRLPGKVFSVGVEGRKEDGSVVIPTVWANVGTIQKGANSALSGASSTPPSGGGESGGSGEDGGYYYPSVSEDGTLSFSPSKYGMPSVESVNIKGQPGSPGEPGYSPVRGVDYWTDADKSEIKTYVDEAILGGAW